ncbi:hypothetical protein TrVE_jg7108 [Triparma verrucosa]|uniref:Alkaline phytoceramidase n=1 Tax=Triparma verrucosa TaxID=1606542 RepID=A0A9W7FDK9_9STRA|nr:hypothetical protein TrVE_jg7108 [Triparma verrucosa]
MPLKLSPSVVAFTLVGLLSCSTTIFILIPPNLQGSRGVDNEGYFGKVTSEIDWCENNYVHTRYIAEFANSTTSLIYCLLAVFSYIESMEQLSKDPGAIKFQLLLVSLWSVGIGSTLFHGTLLYWAQLLDELPMVYLICSAGFIVSTQSSIHLTPAQAKTGKLYIFGCLLLTLTIVLTAQGTHVHNAGRGAGAVAFAINLVFVFHGSSRSAAVVSSIDPSSGVEMNDLFAHGFVCMVLSLVSWILDSIFCEQLLAFSPRVFLNFHAFGWHVFTSLAVYYMYKALIVERSVILKRGDKMGKIT